MHGQRAVVAVGHDAVRGREAEAGAVADVLGGEERVEDVPAVLGGDAGAVVGDAGTVAPGRDRDGAALAEDVDRVVEQVGPHLVEL